MHQCIAPLEAIAGLLAPASPARHPTATSFAGHWNNLALQWDRVGSPLRPCAADLVFFAEAIQQWSAIHGPPRALILGVTPEFWNLPWPAGSHVIAIDQTQEMIDAVWPGPRCRVVRGDWTALPFQSASRDIVLCDGGLQLLAFPLELQKLVHSLRRVISPGGLCIVRLFSPPPWRESPGDVLNDLLAGRISNVNLLKIRLGMALHERLAQGVRLRHIWETLQKLAPDFEELADRVGWPREDLLAINTYRDRQARYFFVSETEARDAFCAADGGFDLEQVVKPAYELGERCPTLLLCRRADCTRSAAIGA